MEACCQTGAPSHVHGLFAFDLNRPNNNFSGLVTDFVQVTAVGKFCKKSLSKFLRSAIFGISNILAFYGFSQLK